MVESGAKPLMHEIMHRAATNLVPLQACLELTYRCNLYCKHCYIDDCLRESGTDELTLLEWSDALDQLLDVGTLSLLLTGGEVFTRSDFFDIAFEAKRRRFLLWLVTNGTLINSEVAARVGVLSPHRVAVSLYGATAEAHEAITGHLGSFETTLQAIRYLREQGVRVEIHALLMDANVKQGPALLELAASLGVPAHLGYELIPTKGCALSPQQYEATFEALETNLPTELLLSGFPTHGMGTCKAGKAVCAISPVGELFPCLLMPLRIGRLREQRFRELWYTKPSKELTYLRSVQKEDIVACTNCSIASFCNRCPGVALSETGLLTGQPPSACRNAAMRSRLFDQEKNRVRL